MMKSNTIFVLVWSTLQMACGGGSLAGSGGSSSADGASATPSTTVNAAGLAAFQSGFWTFARSQAVNCAQCHSSATANIQPIFADTNPQTAYEAAKGDIPGTKIPLIDFSNPTTAAFVTYSGNSHCGAAPCEISTNPATVTADMQAWAKAELSAPAPTGSSAGGSGGGGSGSPTVVAKYLTSAVLLPTTLPMYPAAPFVMQFNLSSLGVSSVANAVFEIQVSQWNADTPLQYRVTNPRLGGNTATVNIFGIHIYVAAGGSKSLGTEAALTGAVWDSITTSAAPFTLPKTLSTTTPIAAAVMMCLTGCETDVDIMNKPLSPNYPFGVTTSITTPDQFVIGFDNIQ